MNWYDQELEYLREGLRPTEAIFVNNGRMAIEKVFINPQTTLDEVKRMRAKYGWKYLESGKVRNIKTASFAEENKMISRGKKVDSNK
jgi:hypothetical protein